jgi:hypothetical protein
VSHAAFYDREFGETTAGTVIAVKSDEGAMIILAATAVEAAATGLERLDCDELTALEVLNAGA